MPPSELHLTTCLVRHSIELWTRSLQMSRCCEHVRAHTPAPLHRRHVISAVKTTRLPMTFFPHNQQRVRASNHIALHSMCGVMGIREKGWAPHECLLNFRIQGFSILLLTVDSGCLQPRKYARKNSCVSVAIFSWTSLVQTVLFCITTCKKELTCQ